MMNFMIYTYIMSCLLLTILYTHLLMTLMTMEIMMMNLMMMMFSMLLLLNMEYFILFYLLIIVCEGVLGLTLMILMIKHKGNDKLKSISLKMW
uniref:NADH-ubiquinone oxidoreductase chain 4L n=1 Tax=Figites sp. ZJUH 20220009 TaxID=2995276 RepID=A0A9E8K016_9HYME|nr:NADH dehydrogenase subunit 4L [Figites sp. ZJUH 20220009]